MPRDYNEDEDPAARRRKKKRWVLIGRLSYWVFQEVRVHLEPTEGHGFLRSLVLRRNKFRINYLKHLQQLTGGKILAQIKVGIIWDINSSKVNMIKCKEVKCWNIWTGAVLLSRQIGPPACAVVCSLCPQLTDP